MENHEINLLSLINSSLEDVVNCSTVLSNHGPIRLKISVSQLHQELYNGFCRLFTFNTPN